MNNSQNENFTLNPTNKFTNKINISSYKILRNENRHNVSTACDYTYSLCAQNSSRYAIPTAN